MEVRRYIPHAQPTLGGSGGFLVPNPGQPKALPPENPQFRLIPLRFGKQNVVPSFETQYGPIVEVRFKYKPDGTRDGGVHQLWTVKGIKNDPTIANCSIASLYCPSRRWYEPRSCSERLRSGWFSP